jgi:hypothetical protein
MCAKGRLPKLCANGVQTSSTHVRGAAGETVCCLQHVLQHLDLVAGFGELLLQAVVGLLQIEGVVLQQRDAAPASSRSRSVGAGPKMLAMIWSADRSSVIGRSPESFSCRSQLGGDLSIN